MLGIFLYTLLLSQIMQIKIVALLFVTTVLTSSFMASILPSANALTTRTDFNDRHTSASYGNSKICGDHKCASGEHAQWEMKVSAAQRGGLENLKQLRNYAELHGEDIMHKIADSTIVSNTMHGMVKTSEKMSIVGNMTKGTK
jgi:hypothetical protein